jgi:phosphate transport system permease protein
MTGTGANQPEDPAPLPPPRIGEEPVALDVDAQVAAMSAPPHTAHPPVIGSAQALAVSAPDDVPVAGAGLVSAGRGGNSRLGDRLFAGASFGAASIVIAIVVMVGLFLVIKSVPSIVHDKSNFLTSDDWNTDPSNLHFGISALLWVTVAISLLALLIATPIAIGIALFITNYAPAKLARPVAFVVDLLAAIPSIVYGIWGVTILAPKLTGVQNFLSHLPGPLFDNIHPNKTIFDGGIVLSIMILPIITAISRDVFERTPRANMEAALALGATKWETIRLAVIPYGRPGVVSACMLGLGRALGETVAIYLIVAAVSRPFKFSLFTGGETFASKIANGSAEFSTAQSTGAYIAAGLVLFVLTFAVNAAARTIVNRGGR